MAKWGVCTALNRMTIASQKFIFVVIYSFIAIEELCLKAPCILPSTVGSKASSSH